MEYFIYIGTLIAIYATLTAGQMPCDGAWADENVRRFRSWLDTGALP